MKQFFYINTGEKDKVKSPSTDGNYYDAISLSDSIVDWQLLKKVNILQSNIFVFAT